MLKEIKIFLLVIGSISLIAIGSFFLFLHFAFDGAFTGPSYNKKDLIENYKKKKDEIIEVRNYFKSILPDGAGVSIEFKNDDELSIFHVKLDSVYQSNWKLNTKSPKVDSLLVELGWSTIELQTLKEKLDKANCISIKGRNPVVIGWQRSGMGVFSYNIFNQNLADDEIPSYNDGCNYIFYKTNVVLEYAGGAIGEQCFSELDRK